MAIGGGSLMDSAKKKNENRMFDNKNIEISDDEANNKKGNKIRKSYILQ